MTVAKISLLALVFAINLNSSAQEHLQWAETPPMGWNSYNCFGAAVNENEVKGNARMLAAHLKEFGWEYIVIDYCWYYPHVGALNNPPQTDDFIPSLPMDEYGRLLPALDRFPSAAGGKGFKDIGEYIHGLGLKFGIHIMRGIPREAVAKKMPVKGTLFTADQITNYTTCRWIDNMYGLDMEKPGAQEYYNSLFEMYAEWGIDYVKIDDISSPFRKEEIAGYRKAIDNCGRKIVLSLSPGGRTPYEEAEHFKSNANLWRISGDFWDNWESLKKQFALLHKWEKHIGPGHWPDADMIPFGRLNRRGPHDGLERTSNFTLPEKYTLMTLWCIARSPLMYGGDLMVIRPTELKLLTNKEVLEVNHKSANNRQLFRNEYHVVWIADVPGTGDKYLAIFNISDDSSLSTTVNLKEIGFNNEASIRDLWKGENIGNFETEITITVEAHGAKLFRVSQ